ncbi:MAG TPA: hypothetical protein VGC90_03725 [Candidatus Limnocylindrales bacterium]
MTEPKGVAQPRAAARPGAGSTAGAAPGSTRRAGTAGAEDRIAELEARLQRLEGSPGIRERGRSMVGRVMPSEAGTHFRNAGREQLLGFRAILDFWLQRIDDADARSTTDRRSERETIRIE